MKTLVIFSAYAILAASASCFAEEGRTGSVTGKWIIPEKGPLAAATVSLFNVSSGPPPSPDRSSRAADVTTTTDSGGRFSVEVPPGDYYLGMTQHRDRIEIGPPRNGELHHFSRGDTGNPRIYSVRPGRTTDVGTISQATPFTKEFTGTPAAIEGTVTDEAGNPVPGVVVFAYSNPEMEGKPLYVSEKTGADGKYAFNADQGRYYLKIRSRYGGGPPEKGEMMGGYGEFGAPAMVEVRRGVVTSGIDIQGKKFPGRGRKD